MENTTKKGTGRLWLSRLAVLAAAFLLLHTCRTCRPFASFIRWEALDAPAEGVQRAFSALSEALRSGDGVVAAFAESRQALTGAAD